jgi:hypothetical protein
MVHRSFPGFMNMHSLLRISKAMNGKDPPLFAFTPSNAFTMGAANTLRRKQATFFNSASLSSGFTASKSKPMAKSYPVAGVVTIEPYTFSNISGAYNSFYVKKKERKELQMSADKKQKQTDRQTVETSHLKFLSHHSKVDVHRNRVWLLRWHQYLSNQEIAKKNYMCCSKSPPKKGDRFQSTHFEVHPIKVRYA